MNLKKMLEKILTEWGTASKEDFTNHALASFFRNNFKDKIHQRVAEFDDSWMTKASVGAGNWANVPWLSVLNPKITNTTQDGVYPVFLFCADGSGVYLSLAQGVTDPISKYGRKRAEKNAQQIKKRILKGFPELHDWDQSVLDLKASSPLGKSYEKSNIAARFYPSGSVPEEEEVFQDLRDLLAIYRKIESYPWRSELVADSSEYVSSVNALQIPKPFLLLAGISGTGKSRFIRKQAEFYDTHKANFCLVAVRPDWHEPSDLLGYTSHLSGTARYIATDVLRFMVAAWKSLKNAGLELSGRNDISELHGTSQLLDGVVPFWLCLDEMNLAPVEQYFADYLSLIETREWRWEGEEFSYACDALLKGNELAALGSDEQLKLARDLGLDGIAADCADGPLWQHFITHGVAIPPNLIVAGTVNMDETTHGFSRKVIDRAMSFDFGEFFPNDFDDFYAGNVSHLPLTFPRHSSGSEALDETDAQASIAFLKVLNTQLKNTSFELAYRALNELLLAVHCHAPASRVELQAVWDDFLMQKVLPRIEGDADKLRASSEKDDTVLDRLSGLLQEQLAEIWGDDKPRPDFYRMKNGQSTTTECRSRRKLQWMQDQLATRGFTSFWP